jgi:signal transduction histidine kinase
VSNREVEPHLKILHTVAETVGRTLDVEEILKTALEALTHVTGHEIASLHLLANDAVTLELRAERGLSQRMRDVNQRLPVGEGIIGHVAASGTTVVVRDVMNSPDLLPAALDAVRRDRIRGFICVPIHARGRMLGTLALGRQTEDPFTEGEVALLEATAQQIAVALDNARLSSELVHIEKLSAVGQLASGVAHEINNPLTAILGLAELLMSRPDVPDPVRERIKLMSQEASRAAAIVRNLLMFARHYPPERRPCSLADAVQRVIALKGYQLEHDDIHVSTELADCPVVWADENQMQQVLLNLVQNAHQAMRRQAGERRLTLRLRPPRDGRVAIEVIDSGPGVPASLLSRIFDPFFTTKPAGEGSGLGLSVSYGIVAQHGGRLYAENRPEGGATFVVELPVGEQG